MLFNSLTYFIFYLVVFIFYWFLTNKNLKIQNILLLCSSYFFYANWDWRFLFLLIFSTLLDYYTGHKIGNSQSERSKKIWLTLSISINLGLLGVFKYYNFFVSSFSNMIHDLGFESNPILINLILPVGISFYTFHGLSYVLDIYNNKIKAEHNFIEYSVFVSFFPLLVAGPIERAHHLLPQIKQIRIFNTDKVKEGLRQVIWGLFKKIVIADTCAQYVNDIFGHYQEYSSLTLILGAIYFAFQIYGDFSGYSDIALGSAKMLGIDLLTNFNYPYFSRDIAEFWRRWHISLNTWFRDYLYIPLGGSKGGVSSKIRNTFAIFLISGFWHGANWTFLVWGAINAFYFLPIMLAQKNRINLDIVANESILPNSKEFIQIILTFFLVTFAWIFFRSDNLTIALEYIKGICGLNIKIDYLDIERYSLEILPLIFLLLVFEWFSRKHEFPLKINSFLKISVVLALILLFGSFSSIQDFIYFQF
jgi:alginate O-acetyltransferase complex protein AlgI